MADRSSPEDFRPGDRSVSYRSRTAVLFAVSEVLGKLAAFGVYAVASRVLGPDGFGQYSWAIALSAVVASFGMFGFDMAQLQLGERHPEHLAAYLTTSIAVRLVAGVVGVGVVAVLPQEDQAARTLVILLTVALTLENVSSALRATTSSLDRQRGPAVLVIVQRLVTAVLSISALLAGFGLVAMGWAYLIGTGIGAVALWILVLRLGYAPRPRHLHVATSMALLKRSVLPGLANVMNMQTVQGPVLTLERQGNVTQVGYYGAGFRLIDASLFVSQSLARSGLPALLYAPDAARVGEITRAILSTNAVVYVPIATALALRGADILSVVFGPEFSVSGPPAVLAAALIAWVVVGPLTTALLSRHHSRDVAGCAAVALVTMLASVVPLTERWSAVGAATSLALSLWVQAGCLWWRMSRRGARPRMGASLVAPLAACVAMTPCLVLPGSIWIAGVLSVPVYAAVWLLLARRLDPGSVARVRSLVRSS